MERAFVCTPVECRRETAVQVNCTLLTRDTRYEEVVCEPFRCAPMECRDAPWTGRECLPRAWRWRRLGSEMREERAPHTHTRYGIRELKWCVRRLGVHRQEVVAAPGMCRVCLAPESDRGYE